MFNTISRTPRCNKSQRPYKYITISIIILIVCVNFYATPAFSSPGDQLWRYSIANNASGFISINTNNILFTTTDGTLYALSKSGTVSWKKTMSYASENSVLVDEFSKLLYYGTGQYLTAIDFSGNSLWEKTITSHITTPFSLDYNFNIVIGTETGLTIANKAGEIISEVALGTAAAKQPVIGTSKYFVPGQDNSIYAVTKSTGTIAWKYSRTSSISPLAIGKHQYVIFGTNNGQLAALNDSGAIVWSKQLSGAITESPVIDSAGNIVVVTNNSNIYSYSENGTLVFSKTISYLSNISATIDCDDNIYISTTQGKIIRLKQDGTTDATYTTATTPLTPISILNKSIIFAQNKFITSIENDNVEPVGFWPEPRQFSTGQASFNDIEWRYNSRSTENPHGCSYFYIATKNNTIYTSGACTNSLNQTNKMVQRFYNGEKLNEKKENSGINYGLEPGVSLTNDFVFSLGDAYGGPSYFYSTNLADNYNILNGADTFSPISDGKNIYLLTHTSRGAPISLNSYNKNDMLWSTTLEISPVTPGSSLMTSDGDIIIRGLDTYTSKYNLCIFSSSDGSLTKCVELDSENSGIYAVKNKIYSIQRRIIDGDLRNCIDSYTNSLSHIDTFILPTEGVFTGFRSILLQDDDIYIIHTEQTETIVTFYASHIKNNGLILRKSLFSFDYTSGASPYPDSYLLTSKYILASFGDFNALISYNLTDFNPEIAVRIPRNASGPLQKLANDKIAISMGTSILSLNVTDLGNTDNSWSGYGKDNLNSRSCYIKGEQKSTFNPSINLLLTNGDH